MTEALKGNDMYIDLGCGPCESHLTMEGEDDSAIWLMTYRFCAAHLTCGFIVPPATTDTPIDEVRRKPLKPRNYVEDE